jgi:hypothetical protein
MIRLCFSLRNAVGYVLVTNRTPLTTMTLDTLTMTLATGTMSELVTTMPSTTSTPRRKAWQAPRISMLLMVRTDQALQNCCGERGGRRLQRSAGH